MSRSAEDQTIEFLARRSDRTIHLWAFCFALGGTTLDLVLHGFHPGTGSESYWAFWIPFCFLVIPAIHYLARKFLALQARVAALEAALAAVHAPISH